MYLSCGFPNTNILTVFGLSLSPCKIIYLCINNFWRCFESRLQTRCPFPLNSSVCISLKEKKRSFSYIYCTVSKFRKLTLIQYHYLMCRSCSNFTSCLTHVLYSERPGSWPWCFSVFFSLWSLVFPWLSRPVLVLAFLSYVPSGMDSDSVFWQGHFRSVVCPSWCTCVDT